MISPTDFAMMVSEDIKGKADQLTRDMLRDPSNHNRWRDNLIQIIDKVNDQITELNTNITSIEQIYADQGFTHDPAESTRNKLEKAERFRYHAEKRLAEVDRLMSMGQVSEDMKLSSFLRSAIEEHMRLKTEHGNHDDIDESLWVSLQGKWAYG